MVKQHLSNTVINFWKLLGPKGWRTKFIQTLLEIYDSLVLEVRLISNHQAYMNLQKASCFLHTQQFSLGKAIHPDRLYFSHFETTGVFLPKMLVYLFSVTFLKWSLG